MLDENRHKQLAEWGFTSIRLGTMWTGIEPEEEGTFNETYVGILKDIVAGLGRHGIYSYLDMHQDVLTGTAEYWGIPPWLADKMTPPSHPYPWPMESTHGFSTWACGYFSQEISNKFQQLYTNHKEEFANIWRTIANRFKNDPNILGYELLNEPWSGDLYSDASLLLPGNSGSRLLQPFFDAASGGIREEDDDTIVFWEPVTYSYFVNSKPNLILDNVLDAFLKSRNFTELLPILEKVCGPMAPDTASLDWERLGEQFLGQLGEATLHRFNEVHTESSRPSVLGPGFTAPPGGWQYLNRTALSWHYYCWALKQGNSDHEYDPILRAVCDNGLGPMVFNTVDARAKELRGSATFLTEFGECIPSFNHTDTQANIECNFVLDQADTHFQSWTYWDVAGGTIFWDSDGNPILDHIKTFSRPYPRATAGKPIYLHYDHRNMILQYQYVPSPSLPAHTEIFVPSLLYTNGYNVEVTSNLHWELDDVSPYILIFKAANTETAKIVIRPKPQV